MANSWPVTLVAQYLKMINPVTHEAGKQLYFEEILFSDVFQCIILIKSYPDFLVFVVFFVIVLCRKSLRLFKNQLKI